MFGDLLLWEEDQHAEGYSAENRGKAHPYRRIEVSGPLWCNAGIQILKRLAETYIAKKKTLI